MITSDAEHALQIPEELRRRIGTPRESTDVNAQVKAGIAAVRIPKHLELVTDIAPGLPNIPCTALDLVVENLVLNAVKAMQDQPGPLRVATWLDDHLHREPFIVVSVQDTGIGMTGDELARLLSRGRRVAGAAASLRHGWVRSWVRRSQGLIEVDSQPGRGTTVNIRFQIDPRQIDVDFRRWIEVRAPIRALIVEDVETWAYTLSRAARRAGAAEVVVCESLEAVRNAIGRRGSISRSWMWGWIPTMT